MENIDISDDIEPETDVDLDAFLKTFRTSMSRRSSLFRTSTSLELQSRLTTNDEWKNYEIKLQQEIKEWDTVWRNTLLQMKKSKSPHPPVDISILPANKLAYLKEAPDLRMYLRNSLELRQKMHVFLEKDYAEMCEMQKNLEMLCDFQINRAKANVHGEQLAKGVN